jgi:hypothetical protein
MKQMDKEPQPQPFNRPAEIKIGGRNEPRPFNYMAQSGTVWNERMTYRKTQR